MSAETDALAAALTQRLMDDCQEDVRVTAWVAVAEVVSLTDGSVAVMTVTDADSPWWRHVGLLAAVALDAEDDD